MSSFVLWKSLGVGDRIKCPHTGRDERVLGEHKVGTTHWFIRTNNHDHTVPKNERVIRLQKAQVGEHREIAAEIRRNERNN